MSKKRKNQQKLPVQETGHIKVETISFRRRGNSKGNAIGMGIGVVLVCSLFIAMLAGTIMELMTGATSGLYIGCIVIGAIAILFLVVYIVFLIRPFFLYTYLFFVNADKKYIVTKNHKGQVFFYTIGNHQEKCYAYIDGSVISHEYNDRDNREGFYLIDGLRNNIPVKKSKSGYSSNFNDKFSKYCKEKGLMFMSPSSGSLYSYHLDDNLRPLYCTAIYHGKANPYLNCYNYKSKISFNPDRLPQQGKMKDVADRYFRYDVIDFNSDNFTIELPSALFTVLVADNIISQDERYIECSGKSEPFHSDLSKQNIKPV